MGINASADRVPGTVFKRLKTLLVCSFISGLITFFMPALSQGASIMVAYNASSKLYYVANINISAGELSNTRPQVLGVYFSFTSPAGSVECRQGYQPGEFTACSGAAWGTLPVYCPTAAEAIRRFRMMLTGAILIDAPSPNTIVEIACMSGPSSAWRFAGPVSPPPLIPASCKIYGPVTLEHGSLSTVKVNGHTASSEIGMECSRESDVVLKIPDNGVIALGSNSGLKSTIVLNGVTGGNVRVNKVGPVIKYITVSSVLSSSGAVRSGDFSGSGVITLEIP